MVLRVTVGPDRGRSFTFVLESSRPIRGGRDNPNDLVLTDDSVSLHHFELRIDESEILLQDLGSTNQTRIGGARVLTAWVVPGTRFRVGGTEIEVHAADAVDVDLWKEESYCGMQGRSTVMRELFVRIERIAGQEGKLGRLPILLGGPTGTGKELAARALHARSPRSRGAFIAVNATATTPRVVADDR